MSVSEVLEVIRTESFVALDEGDVKISVGKMPIVFGAKIHFIQLFQNLIGNSLKFNDKEKPLIKISSKKLKKGWKISVEDNGPGIPEESREKIFDLFNRLKRRDEVEGSGLGLSIVQKIIAQYGANIECVDSALSGAKFEIYMPNTELADDKTLH